MAFDEKLAARVRRLVPRVAGVRDVVEKKMFGGLCVMVNGAMCCGIIENRFMVRVGPEQYADALAQPHAGPMTFTGRPMTGFVYVAPAGYATDPALRRWIQRGVAYVVTLPPKKPKKSRPIVRRPAR